LKSDGGAATFLARAKQRLARLSRDSGVTALNPGKPIMPLTQSLSIRALEWCETADFCAELSYNVKPFSLAL